MKKNLVVPHLLQAMIVGFCLLAMVGCDNPKVKAREKLGRENFAFNADEFVAVAGKGDLPIVLLFLQAGMDPAMVDSDSMTPLLAAAGGGHAKVMEALLKAGADPNQRGREGLTPLMMIAQGSGNEECATLLLDRKVEVQPKDARGWTALLQAAYKGNAKIVALLANKDRGNLDQALMIGAVLGHDEVVRVMLEAGGAVNSRTEDGDTPLHLAVRKGKLGAAQLLLAHKADPFAKNKAGETPTSLAVGQSELAPLFSKSTAPNPQPTVVPAAPSLANPNSWRMIASHEETLPITLEAVGSDAVVVRASSPDSKSITLHRGENVPGIPYRVEGFRRRIKTDKNGIETDSSELTLGETESGQKTVLVQGMPARTAGTYVEIEIPGETAPRRLRQHEEFTLPGEPPQTFRVLDIRAQQVVLRDVRTEKAYTINRADPQ